MNQLASGCTGQDTQLWRQGSGPVPGWLLPWMIGRVEANGTFLIESPLGQQRVHRGYVVIEQAGDVYAWPAEEADGRVSDSRAWRLRRPSTEPHRDDRPVVCPTGSSGARNLGGQRTYESHPPANIQRRRRTRPRLAGCIRQGSLPHILGQRSRRSLRQQADPIEGGRATADHATTAGSANGGASLSRHHSSI